MTDWIMIAVTIIYVIATIFICVFNYRSAKATREQVVEARRQFDESNRAFVTVTFEIIRSGLAVLHIQNYGKRIAQEVNIKVSSDFVENIADKSDRNTIEKLCSESFMLGIGQSWYICIGSHLQLEQMSKKLLAIEISYFDSKTQYCESTIIDLKQYFWSLIYDSPNEDAYQEIKKISKHMKSIDNSINSLQRNQSKKIEG